MILEGAEAYPKHGRHLMSLQLAMFQLYSVKCTSKWLGEWPRIKIEKPQECNMATLDSKADDMDTPKWGVTYALQPISSYGTASLASTFYINQRPDTFLLQETKTISFSSVSLEKGWLVDMSFLLDS